MDPMSALSADPPFAEELLGPGPIQQVRFDLTSRCNLRCVYCAVSQKHYRGSDMPAPLIETALQHIVNLARLHEIYAIDMNGHGETTFIEGWTDVCRVLLADGLNLRLTSNFAKEFTQSELSVLARMKTIAISIDTADRSLLRRVRRKVDLRQIITNVVMVRAIARDIAHPAPAFCFLSGLYDRNALRIEGLAQLAIALGVTHVSFWSLTPYPYTETNVPIGDQVIPLDHLSDEELAPRLAAVKRAVAILRHARISVNFQGDFISTLARRRGMYVD